ncbi:MAG TPA: hypothetical protein VLC08_13625, partial [Chitinolyticbacter sp.]|nr:hypothetical protein [Chitinolyticbacter sp.]
MPALPHSERMLHAALGCALGVLDRQQTAARALAELGDIDLPSAAPSQDDLAQLDVLGPLYLAHELERAELLATAEQVAGLFASGAITQPLGAAAEAINRFWRARRERLDQTERRALFDQVFEAQVFYPMMQ